MTDIAGLIERLREEIERLISGIVSLGTAEEAYAYRSLLMIEIDKLLADKRALVAQQATIAELREALDWIVNDARYKAPEQYADPRTTVRWVQRAASALAKAGEKP